MTREVGVPSRGGSAYTAVYDALAALEDVKLSFVDTYYDAAINEAAHAS